MQAHTRFPIVTDGRTVHSFSDFPSPSAPHSPSALPLSGRWAETTVPPFPIWGTLDQFLHRAAPQLSHIGKGNNNGIKCMGLLGGLSETMQNNHLAHQLPYGKCLIPLQMPVPSALPFSKQDLRTCSMTIMTHAFVNLCSSMATLSGCWINRLSPKGVTAEPKETCPSEDPLDKDDLCAHQ